MILHHFVNGPCGASKRLLGVCAIALALLLPGCFPAPLRVANPVNVKVVDAETGLPIAGASVVHIVCDIHDPDCRDATLLRTATRPDGVLTIDGRRQWGIGFPRLAVFPSPCTSRRSGRKDTPRLYVATIAPLFKTCSGESSGKT